LRRIGYSSAGPFAEVQQLISKPVYIATETMAWKPNAEILNRRWPAAGLSDKMAVSNL